MPHVIRKPQVIFLIGPTAVGKTGLSLKLARRLNTEIISCDSMQVYKGMRILSQAPTRQETRSVRHHLVNSVRAEDEFSVSRFVETAAPLIRSLHKNGKVPLIVGGSGLYVKALVDGLFQSPEADNRFRKKMWTYASRYGKRYLYRKLARIDPETAAIIHQNDTRRVIRALEVYHTTGSAISALKRKTKGLKDSFDVRIFGLTMPREMIYAAIDDRVEGMFKKGIAREVRDLAKRLLSRTARAALGVKEISGYLAGDYSLDEAKQLLKKNTRHFAKRQLAWFRPDTRIRWFDVSKKDPGKIVEAIVRLCK